MNVMHLRFRDSLLLSFGIVLTAISLLAFASMAASIFIADTTQGLATAINESGALRMRSYRIASKLTHNTIDDSKHWNDTYQLITEFEQHLNSPNLVIATSNSDVKLYQAYTNIQQQWKNDIKPLFDVYLDGITSPLSESSDGADMSISKDAVNNLRNRYLLVVSDFVNNIDHLVSLLEDRAESKIKGLRSLQYSALALTTLLTLIALTLIYRRIHRPLKQLLTGAERASQREFSFRIDDTGKDELGRLGSAFNTMAEDLSVVYNELENRIKQKTNDLNQSNLSLELLYKTVNRLSQSNNLHNSYQNILSDIEHVLNIGRGAIFLHDNDAEHSNMIASTLLVDETDSLLCKEINCKQYLGSDNTRVMTEKNGKQIITLPISDTIQQYGQLIIEVNPQQTIEDWQLQLLETITSHIGIAIRLSQQSTESRRLALIEERGAIARELHDSLAQSLTYMKIQLSRLSANKQQSDSDETKIINELKDGLNSAYRELRELLTTFRLKIDGKDINEAMVKTILEFNDRSNTHISYDNQISYLDLTPNEEIHILQLVREALSNVVQHSQATEASVTIQYNKNGDIQITINDNGTGIGASTAKNHHYGLNIMKERSKTLGGELKLTNSPEGGTQILLNFTPSNRS